MCRLISIIITLVVFQSTSYSQCIEKEKFKFGGDYGFAKYILLCPTYAFAYGGDTSKKWNVLNDPIDIGQAPPEALSFKEKVEAAIKNYSGNEFYADLKFQSVDVVYPEKLKLFKDSGRHDVSLKNYKAKFFYYYQYKPDSNATYLIGIALNKQGRIVSPFLFPDKESYVAPIKDGNYCKLSEIIKNKQFDINPIESVKLEYDKKSQRFFWLISQAVTKTHEGRNPLNQLKVDAADFSKVELIKSEASIVY